VINREKMSRLTTNPLTSLTSTLFPRDFSINPKTIEEDMCPDIGPFDFLKNKLDERLRKEQKFEVGGLKWERIPKDRFMKIGKIISEMNPSLPYEEMMERVAFKAIGVNYIKDLGESDNFFEENPDKLLKYREACVDANYVYSDLGGLPDIETPKLGHITLTGTENTEKKESWFKRHKKAVTVGLLGLIGGAAFAGAYYKFIYEPEQRKAPYKQAGLTDEQASNFIKEYPQQNGNSTWVEFAKAWTGNGQLSERTFDTFKNLQDSLSYLYFVNANGYDGLNFLSEYPQFANNYQLALPFYSTNSSLFNIIHNNFLRDPQITLDRNNLTLDALKLYQNLNLVNKNLFLPTIHALNNVTVANKQFGLPEFDKNTLWLLTNCTQKPEGKHLVDFTPIVFRSVDGNDVYITPIPARETWTTAEILKEINQTGFDIKNHPEMFLGLNGKVITNNWCIFDNPYGINYYDKNLSPNDSRVLDLAMLQWNLYSQFAPQRNGSNLLYNRDFPWYNSTALNTLYPDKNELRAALFKLFYLPSETYSIKNQVRKYGIEGARISLTDAFDEYQKIVNLYPNGTLHHLWGDSDVRWDFYGWLVDRGSNNLDGSPRLPNTIEQFIGVDWDTLHKIILENPKDFQNILLQYNGLDQFLTKNWKFWDLVKSIVAYERFKSGEHGGETEGIGYVIPEVLRMFGFPTYGLGINPLPLGTIGEWTVSLPPHVAKGMKEQFSNSNILLGPSYSFGLYSCGDGLVKERGIDIYHNPIKDGIKEVYEVLISPSAGGKLIYLMKRD